MHAVCRMFMCVFVHARYHATAMLAMGELLHARQLATKLDGVDGEFQVEEKAWCDRVDRQTIVFGLACFYLARASMQGAYPCAGGLDYSRFVGGILSCLPSRLDSRSNHRKRPIDPVGFVLMRQQLGIVLLWWVEGYANLYSRVTQMISHEEGHRSTRANNADIVQDKYFSHMLGLLPARLFTDPSLYRHPMTSIYQLDEIKLFQDRESDNVVQEHASSFSTSSSPIKEASRDKYSAVVRRAIACAILPETLGNSGTFGASTSQTQTHSFGSRRSKQRRATDRTRRACNAAARGLRAALCSGEFFIEFAEIVVPLCHIVADIPPPVSSSSVAAGFPIQGRLFDELLQICIVHSVADVHGSNVWMQLFRNHSSAAACSAGLHAGDSKAGVLRLPSAAILQQLKALGWDENPAFDQTSAIAIFRFHAVIGKFLSEAQREGARGLSLQAQMKEQVRKAFSGSIIAFGILLEVASAIFKHETPDQGRRARHLWRTTNPCRMQSALLGYRQLGWDRSALLQSINLERDTIVASLVDAVGSNVLGVVPTAYKEKALRASLAKVAHFVLDRRQAPGDLRSQSQTQTQTQSQSQTPNSSGVSNFEGLSGKQGVSTRRLLLGVGHFRILMTLEQCLLQSQLVAQWGYLKVLSWLLVGGGYYPEPNKRQKWSLLNLEEPLIFSKLASILCRVLLSIVGKVQYANIVADGEQLDDCLAGIEAALFCVEVLNNRIGETGGEGISIDPDGARHNEFAGRHVPDTLRIALVLLWAVAAIRSQFQRVAHLVQRAHAPTSGTSVVDKIRLVDAKILSTVSKLLANRGLATVKVSIELASGASRDKSSKTRFHRAVLCCPPGNDISKAGLLLWYLPALAFNSLVVATAAAFEEARIVSIELARDAALTSAFDSAKSRTGARAAVITMRKRYSLAVFSFISCAHVALNVDQCFGDVGLACATQLCKTFSRAQCARSIVELHSHLWLVDDTRLLAVQWHDTEASPGSSFHDFLHFLHATQSAEVELVVHCRDLLASLLHSCRGNKSSDVLGLGAQRIPYEVMRYIYDALRHFWSLRDTQSTQAAATRRRCGLQRRAFDDDAITAHQDRKVQGHGKGGAAFDDDYPLEVMTLANNLMLCPNFLVARAATKMVASCVSDPRVFSALKERLRQEVETTQMLLCVCLRQSEKNHTPGPGPVNWFDAQFYESRLVRLLVALHTFSYVKRCLSSCYHSVCLSNVLSLRNSLICVSCAGTFESKTSCQNPCFFIPASFVLP